MTMTVAVIPTRYAPPELDALVDVLRGDDANVLIMDNACDGTCNTVARRALTVACADWNIHRMWNVGTSIARGMTEPGAQVNVMVCNDDIVLPGGAVNSLATTLRTHVGLGVVYPDFNAPWGKPDERPAVELTHGTWAGGGMTGFCFMFKGELPLPRFDESLEWYFGDDAFESDVRAMGYGVGRAVGVPIRHEYGTSARRDLPRIQAMIQRDMLRWQARKKGG